MKKVCKDKAFNTSGCRCILFARNPEILYGIMVGKRMEWWIIPKGNAMEIATTGGGMYWRVWKDLREHSISLAKRCYLRARKKYAKTKPLTHQAVVAFFLPVTRRFFPASRSGSGWNSGLSRRVISWK